MATAHFLSPHLLHRRDGAVAAASASASAAAESGGQHGASGVGGDDLAMANWGTLGALLSVSGLDDPVRVGVVHGTHCRDRLLPRPRAPLDVVRMEAEPGGGGVTAGDGVCICMRWRLKKSIFFFFCRMKAGVIGQRLTKIG
jgi:hypothetical protein